MLISLAFKSLGGGGELLASTASGYRILRALANGVVYVLILLVSKKN